jgi:hypothetical protein
MTTIKPYRVEVTAKFPVWGERPSIIEVFARNAKDAISRARREVWNSGYTRQDGPMIYRIKKNEA